MDAADRIADRILGYLGLFLIGAVSWVADHTGAPRRPTPTPGARPTSLKGVRAGVPHQRSLATAPRTGG